MQTFMQLRMLDPDAKLIGPSIAAYDGSFMNTFLSFCKTNSCLPDIVSWHELAGENLTGDLQSYRALETTLGISARPISINEYSGAGDINVEGQPGASAPMIAKFERFQVDSACISYWDVPNPGRLGSLLASKTAKNGGWWFYSWYGAMTGNMVSTTPPTPASPTALDGFANLDPAAAYASVVLGGTNTGTVQVVIKGFHAASFFGTSVHAVVEHTPFVNRTTEVDATTTLSQADYVISTDQIAVPITGANATDGYRVYLTPTDSGAGGAGGVGTATGVGGASGSGGHPGTGGVSGGGGLAGVGAAGGAGGHAGSNGAAGNGGGAGKSGTSGTGGASPTGSGGGGGAGAAAGTGGTSGTAGASGSGGGGADGESGGASGAGGAAAKGGPGAPAGGQSGDSGESASSGCSCQSAGAATGAGAGEALFGLFLFGALRRRCRRRSRPGRRRGVSRSLEDR
jgi:MYXO-CTERM domain-containing protein